MSKINVLVTGGAGYIGSHAVLALRDRGWRVAVIDNLSTGNRELVPADVPFHLGSIADQPLVEQVIEQEGIGAIMHFAGSIVVPESLEKPLDARSQEVQVDVYDPSFFVAFGFATEAPVKLSGTAIKGCTAEIKKPDPESEEDAKALSEAFFSQLGPNSNFGSQFAQTVMVKCSDAPS